MSRNRLLHPVFIAGLSFSAFSGSALSADPVLGHLQVRGYKVTIISRDNEPHYLLTTLAGKRVGGLLNHEQLAARYPAVYRRFHSAVAGNSSNSGAIPWAGQ